MSQTLVRVDRGSSMLKEAKASGEVDTDGPNQTLIRSNSC